MAAARLPAARATAAAKASARNDGLPDWRGKCAICLDLLSMEGSVSVAFYPCCCKKLCADCAGKCFQHDERCPLCRAPSYTSDAEFLRRLQEHVDKGNAEAHFTLAHLYQHGLKGLKKSPKRAFQLYELAAAHGHAPAQNKLGHCYYEFGNGVEIDYETAAQWFQRAAEQSYPLAQFNLGNMFYDGNGVAQSYAEAVKWWRLAAAQGNAEALCSIGLCHGNGNGVPRDLREALRWLKRAAAKGHAEAAAEVEKLAAYLARGPPEADSG